MAIYSDTPHTLQHISMHSGLPGCESMGEGEPERDWKVAPFSDGIAVFISRLGEGPRPNTRLPPPGGPPFKDPLVRSKIQCKQFKHIHHPQTVSILQ
jgi:hypothetical protein